MEQPTPDILTAAQQGSLQAFDAIISYYQPAIYNHLFRLLSSAEDAADLAQETFLKLYKTRERIQPDAHFKAYLYKIATNTAYDWLKKKRRHPEDLIIDDDNANFATIESELSYYKIEELDLIGLNLALDKIKPASKNLLLLYYQQGFNYQEISEIVGQPLGTVKSGLLRAKQELLKKIS
jgi:RNA polymerase sigma-70 factor (ECF subfamily)